MEREEGDGVVIVTEFGFGGTVTAYEVEEGRLREKPSTWTVRVRATSGRMDELRRWLEENGYDVFEPGRERE